MSEQPLSVSKGQSVVFSVSLELNLAPGDYELRTTPVDRLTGQIIFRETVSYFVIQKDIRCGGGISFLDPQLIEWKVSS